MQQAALQLTWVMLWVTLDVHLTFVVASWEEAACMHQGVLVNFECKKFDFLNRWLWNTLSAAEVDKALL
jgi:hypothetical protein